ncbi:MAG: hypothetical protein FJ271_24905 [Planctomycetes bacterium]|nr:hypothetical protein [Planctomycetota bacterium]
MNRPSNVGNLILIVTGILCALILGVGILMLTRARPQQQPQQAQLAESKQDPQQSVKLQPIQAKKEEKRTQGKNEPVAIQHPKLEKFSDTVSPFVGLHDDCELVLVFNLKQLLDSELAKSQHNFIERIKATLTSKLANQGQLVAYLKKFNVDPLRDLHKFTFGHPGSKDPQDGMLVVEGKFDPVKFNSTFKELSNSPGKELRILLSGKTAIYQFDGKPRPAYVALHDGKALVLGFDQDRVTTVVAQLGGTCKPKLRPEITKQLATMKDKQTLCFVATAGAMANVLAASSVPASNTPNFKSLNIKEMMAWQKDTKSYSLALTLRKDLDLQFATGMADRDTASKMADAGNLMLPFLREMVPQEAKTVIDTMRFKADGSSVLLRAEVPFATLKKLLDNASSVIGQ